MFKTCYHPRPLSARWDHIDFSVLLPDAMTALDPHRGCDDHTKSTTTASEQPDMHDMMMDVDDPPQPPPPQAVKPPQAKPHAAPVATTAASPSVVAASSGSHLAPSGTHLIAHSSISRPSLSPRAPHPSPRGPHSSIAPGVYGAGQGPKTLLVAPAGLTLSQDPNQPLNLSTSVPPEGPRPATTQGEWVRQQQQQQVYVSTVGEERWIAAQAVTAVAPSGVAAR